MSTDLALRSTVREIVAVFAQAEADVRAAFATIAAAEDRLNNAFAMGEIHRPFRVSACGQRWTDNYKEPDEAIRLLSRPAWRTILERFELRRFLSIARWEALEKQIEEDRMPPITEESVTTFLFGQLSQAREHLEEAIHEVFEWLRPKRYTRAGQLKTNSELEVPSKVILPYVVHRGYRGFEVDYDRRQNLVALENVFRSLDGQGVITGYESELETAIKTSADGEGETPLFTFRACLNRNLHLTFKRADLLARFNALAGGKRLRPAETEEERLRREVREARAENERLKRQAAREATS